jgi:hypothetical protein
MGQAKLRKLKDPDYGKPKLRGLIVSSPITIDGHNMRPKSISLDPQDLRFSLMYWDRIAWPKSIIFGSELTPDEQFLNSAGILYRPPLPIPNYIKSGAEHLFVEQETAYSNYEKTEPGVWSIGHGVNSLRDISATSDPTLGSDILLTLLSAIPVPKRDVPYPEILEFKHKRRDELLNFRNHLETMVESIKNAEDPVDELHKKLKEVDNACVNLLKTTREWQSPVYLSNFEISLQPNLTKAFDAIRKIEQTSSALAMDETSKMIATILAVAESQVKLSGTPKLRPFKKARSPYRYAFSLNKQLEL